MKLTTEQKARFEEIEELRVANQDNDLLSLAIEDWGLYNNGIVVCKWWNSNDTLEDIEEYYKLLRIINNVGDFEEVELFAADIENDTLNIYNEHKSISSYFEEYEKLENITEQEKAIIAALMENDSYYTVETAMEKLEDVIIWGDCKNLEDVAYEMVENGYFGEINSSIKYHIDYSSIARDLDIEGTFLSLDYDTMIEVSN